VSPLEPFRFRKQVEILICAENIIGEVEILICAENIVWGLKEEGAEKTRRLKVG
jgi:hypothetical protein